MTRMFFLLALLAAFPPLSTDMYLGAIPTLQKQFQQPLAAVNLTLIFFFISYCLFLLVYGPISDRCGRRPPLLVGIVVFVVASLMCALAAGLTQLILFRICQAAGAAGASAISLAICKDIYEGRQREKVLAHLAVAIGLAPMLAPVLGGWLLSYFSWPAIFIAQALLGCVALAGVWKMEETHTVRVAETAWKQVTNYLVLLRNGRFMGLAMVTAISMLPIFSFVAASSDIYINQLGLSEKNFGYFFGMNAIAYITGSYSCSLLVRRVPSRHLMTAGFAGISIGGAVLFFAGRHSPWQLGLPMLIISFFVGLCRPSSTNLALEQVKKNAGAASSFLVFTLFFFGAVAMWMVSKDWADKVNILAWLGIVCGLSSFIAWLGLQTVLDFSD